ncbi:glycosyltransferase family 4 protein [Myxacorys almedinensis]|uniref:Glycosyltransferase n=1 Tax=Myxacorys almedinensis A TaxID=2690445 RepID=A0A8J7Z0R8_9CYAN|nr:glycosyltransferase family 4 protein [Myxacorys almedinensis]NDJ16066.1 glycosyltransferase [Myxacorys almedinensis A]
MRIAYLTGEYPRATDTFIQREVAGLRKLGIEVFTFAVRRPGDEHMVGEEQTAERDRTSYLLPPNLLQLVIAHLMLFLSSPGRYLRSLGLAWSTRQPGLKGLLYQLFYFLEAGILAKQIQRQQIQHLHNHLATSSGTVAMIAAALGGFTYSFTLHGPYIFFEPYQWRLHEKIQRSLFVCCISHYCRSQGMIFASAEKWNRMHIIHCGIDPSLFKVTSHTGTGKKLLYVGRLAAVKGLPILLESLAQLKSSRPDLKLTVVGDGPDRAQLEQTAHELGLSAQVNFVGYQSQTNVRQQIQQTDIFVMSSFAEGVPVVLMEAMAAGVPVIATQIAGVGELVEDKVSGYLVPPGDVESLRDRIVALAADADLRSRFGKAGREKVEQDFNIHHEVARLHQILKQAIEGKVEAVRPEPVFQPGSDELEMQI